MFNFLISPLKLYSLFTPLTPLPLSYKCHVCGFFDFLYSILDTRSRLLQRDYCPLIVVCFSFALVLSICRNLYITIIQRDTPNCSPSYSIIIC